MKFITFKLFSARNVIQLDEPIRFNKIRVNIFFFYVLHLRPPTGDTRIYPLQS